MEAGESQPSLPDKLHEFVKRPIAMEPSTESPHVFAALRSVVDLSSLEWNPEWDKPKKSWIQPIPKQTAQERSLLER